MSNVRFEVRKTDQSIDLLKDPAVRTTLGNAARAGVASHGCKGCGGKNLDIVVDAVGRTSVSGSYHCNDCGGDGRFRAEHTVVDQVEAEINAFQRDLEKMFR